MQRLYFDYFSPPRSLIKVNIIFGVFMAIRIARWDSDAVLLLSLFLSDISNWDVSNVIDFRVAFANASSFNQDLSVSQKDARCS